MKKAVSDLTKQTGPSGLDSVVRPSLAAVNIPADVWTVDTFATRYDIARYQAHFGWVRYTPSSVSIVLMPVQP